MSNVIRWWVEKQGNNSTAATWALEDQNGNPVDISASTTCGFQEFINLCHTNGCDGIGDGGPATTVNGTIAFLSSVVDFPPFYSGKITLRGVSLICTHTGSYVIRTDSMMVMSFEMDGGQIVLNGSVANQIGFLIQPRSVLPVDTQAVAVTSRIKLSSVVGAQGTQRGNGQVLIMVDGSTGTCQSLSIDAIEPNGGDYGLVTRYGAHGYNGLRLKITGAHQQYYSCVSLGYGAAAPVGSLLTMTALSGNYSATSQLLDTWEQNGIYDLTGEQEGTALPPRSITFESPSKGCQVRLGGAIANITPTLGAGSGPNFVNNVYYHG